MSLHPQKKSTQSASRGFTLIELLTVIAVIAILGAILVPVLSSVRQSANTTQSISNLRQMGMAINLYKNEKGAYPQVVDATDTHWQETVSEYLNLPVESRKLVLQDPTVEIQAPEDRDGVSHYSAHQWVLGHGGDDRFPGLKPFQVAHPSSLMLVVTGTQDGAEGNAQSSLWNIPWTPYDANYTSRLNEPIPLTGSDEPGGINYRLKGNNLGAVMADGHVKTIERGSVTWRNIAPIAN